MNTKFFIINFLFVTISSLFATQDSFPSEAHTTLVTRDIPHSEDCKALLKQANKFVKEKLTKEGIALFKKVRDHPQAEVWMILQASKDLRSYQLIDDALIGFRRSVLRKDATAFQAMQAGKLLLELMQLKQLREHFPSPLLNP
jgi:hypothetical protein